jgi:hypothetical protein
MIRLYYAKRKCFLRIDHFYNSNLSRVCSTVEYTIPDEENPPDLKMVQGSAECQLFLVTKRHKLSSGVLRFTTSIWALSDDKNVRVQQERECFPH